jgi:RimJ/RimL family protein N-acetyltransferase
MNDSITFIPFTRVGDRFSGAVVSMWGWLQEQPWFNFDDYGPRTLFEFKTAIEERLRNERMWLILKRGHPCGIVAYLPFTPRVGFFHGICFPKGHCTREEKRAGIRLVIEHLFAAGVEKINAQYFFDNQKIDAFLKDLGAVREGYLKAHTMRNGAPTDMVQVAIFKEKGTCPSGDYSQAA